MSKKKDKVEELTGKQKRFCEDNFPLINSYMENFRLGVENVEIEGKFNHHKEQVLLSAERLMTLFDLEAHEVCQFAFSYHEKTYLLKGVFTKQSSDALYFIQGSDCIKIGRTHDLKTRMSALQVSVPYKLHYIKSFPGRGCYEKDLHEMFDHIRLKGEWFRANKCLYDFIELLSTNNSYLLW